MALSAESVIHMRCWQGGDSTKHIHLEVVRKKRNVGGEQWKYEKSDEMNE